MKNAPGYAAPNPQCTTAILPALTAVLFEAQRIGQNQSSVRKSKTAPEKSKTRINKSKTGRGKIKSRAFLRPDHWSLTTYVKIKRGNSQWQASDLTSTQRKAFAGPGCEKPLRWVLKTRKVPAGLRKTSSRLRSYSS
jgi:hypothetical protein